MASGRRAGRRSVGSGDPPSRCDPAPLATRRVPRGRQPPAPANGPGGRAAPCPLRIRSTRSPPARGVARLTRSVIPSPCSARAWRGSRSTLTTPAARAAGQKRFPGRPNPTPISAAWMLGFSPQTNIRMPGPTVSGRVSLRRARMTGLVRSDSGVADDLEPGPGDHVVESLVVPVPHRGQGQVDDRSGLESWVGGGQSHRHAGRVGIDADRKNGLRAQSPRCRERCILRIPASHRSRSPARLCSYVATSGWGRIRNRSSPRAETTSAATSLGLDHSQRPHLLGRQCLLPFGHGRPHTLGAQARDSHAVIAMRDRDPLGQGDRGVLGHAVRGPCPGW